MRDSSCGWDLGPDLNHFSSRTQQVLQYMNPNKINMDLLVDLMDYLGITYNHADFRYLYMLWTLHVCNVSVFLSPEKSPQFAEVDGAILVFLPGLAHIQQLYDLLSSDKRFRDKNR